jgi:topoisomerase-4 subunit A
VLGIGRGGKAKDEPLSPAEIASHQGKRARKGHKIHGAIKPQRVLPA